MRVKSIFKNKKSELLSSLFLYMSIYELTFVDILYIIF